MQYKTILRLLGILLLLFSPSMLTPLIINAIFQEHVWVPFVASYTVTIVIGGTLWFGFRKHQNELKIREGFLIVVIFWFTLSCMASLPFLLETANPLTLTNALFETISGMTTSGTSIIENLDTIPRALLFYRQQLQFLGGIGIVVLAVAILPMLGVGGMQLYRAETPGPMKDSKLTPRITQTAKALWSIYLILTLLCAFCYWIGGMSWFDAIGESFGTVSTGGFSMHNNSFAYYHSDTIRLIASLFMLLGGTNFALHFIAFQKRSLKGYWQDEEFRYYLAILFVASCIIAFTLVKSSIYHVDLHTFVTSVFTIISYATTTGFELEQFTSWPTFVPPLIMLLMIIGGCAASTSGGIKVLRTLILFKQSRRELKKLLHPQAIIPIKLGNQSLSESILQSMWGFISVFIALYLVLILIFMALGHDLASSLAAITASLANAGSDVGNLTISFQHLDIPSKWLLIFAMLMGRLELFSILILFTRQFWQK
ncbi:MAG: TrkH family potassium uptake protein [Legionellaceae bacterium]|nr:TrkH family potassium uptake protein [Legionellaceae bacterium]